jgi:hypothetical protein
MYLPEQNKYNDLMYKMEVTDKLAVPFWVIVDWWRVIVDGWLRVWMQKGGHPELVEGVGSQRTYFDRLNMTTHG